MVGNARPHNSVERPVEPVLKTYKRPAFVIGDGPPTE
jgi:hypothetical protein